MEVSGIGLSSDDEAMLLVTCGMGQPILRAGKIQELKPVGVRTGEHMEHELVIINIFIYTLCIYVCTHNVNVKAKVKKTHV